MGARARAGVGAAIAAVLLAIVLAGYASADGETIHATQGSPFDGPVVSFTGPQPASASIDWGDSTSSDGAISGSGRSWTVSGTHTYHAHGDFTITVTVTNSGGGKDTHPASAAVAPAGLTVAGAPVGIVQGNVGPRVAGHVTDADAGHPASFYTGTIAWGDGASSPATVTPAGDGFDLVASHSYRRPGSYPASLSVTTADGRSATTSFPLTVSPATGTTGIQSPQVGPIKQPGPIRAGRKNKFTQSAKAAPGHKIVLRLWQFEGKGVKASASSPAPPKGDFAPTFAGSQSTTTGAIASRLASAPTSIVTKVIDESGGETMSATKPKKATNYNCNPNARILPIHKPDVMFSASKVSEEPPTESFDASDTVPGYHACRAPKDIDSHKKDLKFTWDFGDGSAKEAAGPIKKHVFPDDGKTHTVTLTATDKFGTTSLSMDVKPSNAMCDNVSLSGWPAGGQCMHPVDLGDHIGYLTNVGGPLALGGLLVTPHKTTTDRILVVPATGTITLWPVDQNANISEDDALHQLFKDEELEFRRLTDITHPVGGELLGFKVPASGMLHLLPISEFTVGGLLPAGGVSVQLTQAGSAAFSIAFKPPAPFAGAEFPDLSVADPNEDYTFAAPDMSFGAIEARNLIFTLHPGGALEASGGLAFFGGPTVKAHFAFDKNHQLVSATAADDESPSIPLTTGLGLAHVGAGVNVEPFQITGDVLLDSNPFTLGSLGSLYSVNGCFNFAKSAPGQKLTDWCLPDGGKGTFVDPDGGARVHATGVLKIIADRIELAHASLDANKKRAAIHGDFGYGLQFPDGGPTLASANGTLDLAANFDDGRMEASGGVSVCAFDVCQGGSGLVSNVGAAVCVPIEIGFDVPFVGFVGTTVDMGGWLRWDFSDGGLIFHGCDVHDHGHAAVFKGLPRYDQALAARSGPSVFAAAGTPTFTVKPKADPIQVVAVKGIGHSPNVVVHGPGRMYVDTGKTTLQKTQTKKALFLHSDDFTGTDGKHVSGDDTTYVVLGNPKQGKWTVDAAPGSAPIQALATATAPLPPTVKGNVVGSGDARKLDYTAKGLASGEKVSFVEYGNGVARKLGQVGNRKNGKMSFDVTPGTAGQRKIVALVIGADGIPTHREVVDSYKAERPTLPATPKVDAKPSRGKLALSWKPVAGAARYTVSIDLGDGRTIRRELTGSVHSLVVPGLEQGAKAVAHVTATDGRGVVSKAGSDSTLGPIAPPKLRL